MKHRLTTVLLSLAVGACAAPSAHDVEGVGAEPSAARAGAPRSYLPERGTLEALLRDFDVPGLAATTLSGCEPGEVVTLGSADLGTGAPVTAATAFEAASLTKPLFAYLVMQLVDEGVIDLDAPIASSLDYPRVADRGAYARLTPRMILAHRTGMPNWVGDTDDPERTDAIAFATAPGTAYSYSGEAYELLRAHVERQSGASLSRLFEERLGATMAMSTLGEPLPDRAEPSRGYRSAGDPGSGRDLAIGTAGAAGGLVTTVGDYAAFLARVCRGEGLSAGAFAEMLRPQSPVPPGNYPGPASWSLGWAVVTLGEETIVMHDGNNDEYRSFAAFLPGSGEGYVMLANGANGDELIAAVMERVQQAAQADARASATSDAGQHDPEADFEAFWSLYDERYALFEVKHVDWNAVRAVYRPRVTAATSRDELFALFEKMTDLLNDVHVTVTDRRTGREARSGGRSLGTGPFDVGVFSPDLVETRYAIDGLETRLDGTFRFGWLEEAVGYVHIASLRRPQSTAAAMDEAIETFASARAVVLDLRQNGGGLDEAARVVASRFADRRRLALTVEERVPSETGAFTAPVPLHVEPSGVARFTGPVVVLVNSRTISAAENLVIMMRTLPHALVVGETTAGVMADAYPVAAGDGWTFGVPVNRFRDADGISWEGIGLVPDLWASNSREDIESGTDRVLETALDFAATSAARPERRRVRRRELFPPDADQSVRAPDAGR